MTIDLILSVVGIIIACITVFLIVKIFKATKDHEIKMRYKILVEDALTVKEFNYENTTGTLNEYSLESPVEFDNYYAA